MKNTLLLSVLVGALVIAGGAFYGGMVYGKSKGPGGMRGQAGNFVFQRGAGANGPGAGQGGARNFAGGLTNGEVVAKDATSITLKLRDGGSKNVFYSTSTSVNKMAQGSMDDLSQGTQVMVNGTANQDGSITASMIQIRPEGFMMNASSTRESR